MNNFSMLNYQQILGIISSPKRISFFGGNDRNGRCVELSDFAVLRGARVEDYNYSKSWRHRHIIEANKNYDKTKGSGVPCGVYWLEDSTGPYNQEITRTKYDYWGDIESEYTYYPYDSNTDVMLSNKKGANPSYTDIVARISVPYDEIADECTKKENDELDGVLEVEYGEYPQNLTSNEMQKKLEEEFNKGSLEETGKVYTMEKSYKEYEYNGKKYIRIDVKAKDIYRKNSKEYKNGDSAWIEVQPIRWWVDEKLNLAFTEKGFLTGQAFHIGIGYHGNFQKTTIKKYLDKHFANDIIPSKLKTKNNYNMSNIITGNYNEQELKQMTQEEKQQVITTLAQEVKETLDKLREFAEELDHTFGEVFDKQIKKEKENNKQKVKVKVRKK